MRQWSREFYVAIATSAGTLPFPRNAGIALSLGAAVIAGTSVVYGFATTNACRRANQELLVRNMQSAERRADEANRTAAAAMKRDYAWALTKTAAAAGRAGDCDTVRTLDLQVRALDSEFHGSVFIADLGINRCLASVTSAPAQQ